MADTDPAQPLADLVDGGTIVMLMTMIGDEHSSRPLTVAAVDGSRLEFLVDATTDWATAVRSGGVAVHASVSDTRANTYLSLQGSASMTLDAADVQRLWSPAASAFFDGPDDPALGVLRFDVDGGEYWDSPGGRIGSAIALLKAKLGDDPGAAGAHGSVTAT
ncbi:MAG: pyridoxamine 5'-phosphate oxidase family protein [Ilumatobacteraceae bacterium]